MHQEMKSLLKDQFKDIQVVDEFPRNYFGHLSTSTKSWTTKSPQSAHYDLGIRDITPDSSGYAPITVGKNGSTPIVTSFIHPETGLTVVSDGEIDANAQFEKIYKKEARDKGLGKLEEVKEEDWFNKENKNEVRLYKTEEQIFREIMENYEFPTNVKKNYLKYLTGITNYSLYDQEHRINQYISYELDHQSLPNYGDKAKTTRQLPTANPWMTKPLKETDPEKWQEIDDIISVFFDDESKVYFNNYIGAIFSNATLKEMSKMLVIKSVPGAGKSTLTDGLSAILDNYSETYPDFDDFFRTTARFARSQFKNKRVLFYDEANWGEGHDFTNLDESSIKSFITDGIYRTEAKYQDQRTVPITALQVVCTNYIPKVTTDSAMDRRLLLVHMKNTSMLKEKAQELPGSSQEEFIAWWVQNQKDLIRYFADHYQENTSLVLHAPGFSSRKEGKTIPNEVAQVISFVEKDHEVNKETLTVMADAINEAVNGYSNPYAQLLKNQDGTFLLLSATKEADHYFGQDYDLIKNGLKAVYPMSRRRINKTQQRCFMIPLKS